MDISFADCRVERYEQNLSWSAAQFEVIEGEVEGLVGLSSVVAASAFGRAMAPGSR
jgi:hypothetical protein